MSDFLLTPLPANAAKQHVIFGCQVHPEVPCRAGRAEPGTARHRWAQALGGSFGTRVAGGVWCHSCFSEEPLKEVSLFLVHVCVFVFLCLEKCWWCSRAKPFISCCGVVF